MPSASCLRRRTVSSSFSSSTSRCRAFVSAVAHVVEAHARLDERVLHPSRDRATLLRLGGPSEQIVERTAEVVEHHDVELAREIRRCTIQIASSDTQPHPRFGWASLLRRFAPALGIRPFNPRSMYAPFVIVTATTETIRGRARVRAQRSVHERPRRCRPHPGHPAADRSCNRRRRADGCRRTRADWRRGRRSRAGSARSHIRRPALRIRRATRTRSRSPAPRTNSGFRRWPSAAARRS